MGMTDLVQRLTDALEGILTVYADLDYQALIAEARAALAAPVANGWLEEAERLLQRFRLAECCAAITVGQILEGFDYVADATAKYEKLLTHLRNHPAFLLPEWFAPAPTEPTIDGGSFNEIKKIYKAIIAVGSGK